MSNALEAITMIAIFIVIAAVVYMCLSLILKRIENRHDRRSSDFRR